jgi:outer membrane protein insertion porin family
LYYRTYDPTETSTASGFTTDSYGGRLQYGVPLSEYDTFSFGFSGDRTRIKSTSSTSQPVLDFCAENASLSSCEFDSIKTELSWSFDSRDVIMFPTEGTLKTMGANVALPVGGKSLSFYKLNTGYRHYLSLFGNPGYVLQTKADLGYGNVYGETTDLPPFEKYYAGGVRTLRGFRPSSLGPRDVDGNALGGNARVLANAELIFRGPFSEENSSARLGLFIDAGNVFGDSNEISASELRYTTGLAFYWITPVGPLTFSYAQPLVWKSEDKLDRFQFNIGLPF